MQCGFAGQRDDSLSSGMELGGVRLHHATQNGVQIKTNEMFTSGIFKYF